MALVTHRTAVLAGCLLTVTRAAAATPAADTPERWQTGAALGDDRSGDLRPEAAAILDAIADAGDVFSVADARALGLVRAPRAAFTAPTSIRIWRRALDGSTASCSGRVDVIPFEKYVKGVLPHEWIRSWGTQSLEAGAVAIRSYAAAWVASGGKYSCADLDDTTASQVYRDEYFANTDAAVDATAGQYVVRGGELVFAEYSAENGDPTALGVDEPLCAGQTVNGHGRGTCQWGTQRWAQDGQTYAWMMRHYYPGADVTGAAPTYDAAAGGASYPTTMVAGDEGVAWFELVNGSSVTWDLDQTRLGTATPQDRASPFFVDGNWLSPSRATGPDHSGYTPGATGRFTFAIRAPEVTEPTTYDEAFQLVQEGVTWFGPVVHMTITVTPRPADGGGDTSLTGNPDLADDGTVDPPADGGLVGGCSAGGTTGSGTAGLLLIALAALRRRR